MRPFWRATVAALVLSAAGAVTYAVPPPDDLSMVLAASSTCEMPDNGRLVAAAVERPEGHRDFEDWVAAPAAQEALERVNAKLEARFGEAGRKDGSTPALEAGLVGLRLDHVGRQARVVVEPSLVADASLRAELEAAAGGQVPVKVVAACRSTKSLVAASGVLRERSWHQLAAVTPFSAWLDPGNSKYRVTFGPGGAAVAAALQAQLGDAVEITMADEAPSRAGRLDDGEPHWGGAAIGDRYENYCSSGFTVIRSDGRRGSVTAGHCYDNGAASYSGGKFYGYANGKVNYPAYDMMRVDASGQSYDNRIHVDPCCPSVRDVTGSGDTAVGRSICVSGYKSRAICGAEVISMTGRLCDPDGCTYGLIRARKEGTVLSRGGDSGGPMYTRPTSSTANIRGMIIGGDNGDVLGERISNVTSHLDVRVATS